ncbi:MAG: GPR endopeptidase [Eubacteriales bacterium]|nr:GPR endopeptidase [Eubacteriales bacterium]
MEYRTDLAIENKELYEEARKKAGENAGEIKGVIMEKEDFDEDIKVTRIEVVSEEGANTLGKPIGNYITLEINGIVEEVENIKGRAAQALAAELKKMINFHYYLKVLVVGLGNEKVTPDSLGPHSASKVKITRHLFKIYDCDGDEEMGNVAGITPGVTGTTGIETAELIQKTVEMTTPQVVIVIDALAAKNIDRVSTTIQICDTGISPGAGMGNNRKVLNEETLGAKVIAIGVPTVIDSRTLIIDALSDTKLDDDMIKKYLNDKKLDMIVTSTDIDIIIKEFSDIIANGINITLHPGIYS